MDPVVSVRRLSLHRRGEARRACGDIRQFAVPDTGWISLRYRPWVRCGAAAYFSVRAVGEGHQRFPGNVCFHCHTAGNRIGRDSYIVVGIATGFIRPGLPEWRTATQAERPEPVVSAMGLAIFPLRTAGVCRIVGKF